MNIGFESFTAVHENQQCGTDASTEIIYLGNISSCMLGHVAHNSGSQAALLDFCLTNLPRAAPQSPGVYPFQPKTVTMTAICRGRSEVCAKGRGFGLNAGILQCCHAFHILFQRCRKKRQFFNTKQLLAQYSQQERTKRTTVGLLVSVVYHTHKKGHWNNPLRG